MHVLPTRSCATVLTFCIATTFLRQVALDFFSADTPLARNSSSIISLQIGIKQSILPLQLIFFHQQPTKDR